MRTSPRVVLATLGAGIAILVAAGPSSAAAPTRDHDGTGHPRAVSGPTLAIGDSVMLGAQRCLEDRGFEVDAAGSRQATAVEQILAASADLAPVVVVHTGTNGGTDAHELRRIIRAVGPDREIVLVTIQLPDGTSRYTFEDSTNDAIRRVAARFSNVHVADWNGVANAHPEYTGGDEIHLTVVGCTGYARLLTRVAHEAYLAAHPYVPMRQPY